MCKHKLCTNCFLNGCEHEHGVMEKCPMCTGNGKIDSSLLLIETIENKIQNLTQTQKGEIKIAAHPFVASHINKGIFFTSIS